MLPIHINVSELISEFNISNNDVSDLKEEILSGLINELYRNWEQQAREKLKSTRSQYIRSLRVFREGKFKGGIELVGWLPNKVESGLSAFDVKIGELNSRKVKIGAKGQRYITVPFRIGTPNIVGESQAFSNIMPSVVYNIAKSLKSGQHVKKYNLPPELQQLKTRPIVKTQTKIFEAYTHKSPIFQGIQKGQGQFHGQYTSFRRISDAPDTGSNPNSWIHRGIQAYNLSSKALEKMNVSLITDMTIDNFLNQKFG